MPGAMWLPFRKGNRSEYLALYILSALGIVVKVPREEDIGADFYCSLTKIEGNRMSFYAPFLVQVKSESEKEVIYGGPDKKGRWKKEEIEWLFSQELPLLIGLVDKEKLTLGLYSTSNMWSARYLGGNTGQVVLQPNIPDKQGEAVPMPKPYEMEEWTTDIGDRKKWEVPLGPPVVFISIDELENEETMEHYRQILQIPLHLEQQNISYRRLRVHFSAWPFKVETNKPSTVYGVNYAFNPTPGVNTDGQLKSLAPIIATLAFNYKSQKRYTELEKLKKVVQLLPAGQEVDLLKKHIPELFVNGGRD
jgi:hypothetical protein